MAKEPDREPRAAPMMETPGSVDEGEGFLRLLRDLLDHKWVVLLVASFVFASVAFWTISQPKVYEATVSLEYDPRPPKPLGRSMEDVASPAVGSYWESLEWYATQNQILSSRALSERVVRKLGLHHDPDFLGVPEERRKEWSRASVEQAAAHLQGKLRVEQVEGTRLVRLKLQDVDPARAQLLANTLAEAYVEKNVEDRLASTASALRWLSTQLEDFRKKLSESELALHAFKKDNQVLSVGLEDKQNLIARDIERYSEELARAKARRIELGARLAELRQAVSDDPMRVHASIVLENPRVRELRAEIQRKEEELAGASVRYGEAHPLVVSLQRRLERARGQLREEIEGIVQSVERDVSEASRTIGSLESELRTLREAGLRLNLLEIEYNRLTRERENNEKIYQIVLARTTETDMARALPVANVRILDRAVEPQAPVKPRVLLNMVAGAFGGILLGLGLALVLSRMDHRLKDVRDVERIGVPLLGLVPTLGEVAEARGRARAAQRGKLAAPEAHEERDLVVSLHPKSVAAEAIRSIRTNLVFMSVEQPLRTLLVTSPSPQEGKTTLAVNLAVAIAQSGKRVVLVDTDLRRPRIHHVFGLSNERGVSTVLVGEVELERTIQQTAEPGLFVVSSGPVPPNPSELLHSGGFQEFVDALAERFDIVVFDSPPVNIVTDAAVVAAQVDGVVTIAYAHRTTRDALRMAVRRIHEVGARFFGVVFNGADKRSGSYGYGYGGYYRYGYYTSAEEHDDVSSSAA